MFRDIKNRLQKLLVYLVLLMSFGSGIAQASEDHGRDYYLTSILFLLQASQISWNALQQSLPENSTSQNVESYLNLLDTDTLGEVVDSYVYSTSIDAGTHGSFIASNEDMEGGVQFQNNHIIFQSTPVSIADFMQMFFNHAEAQHWFMPENAAASIEMILHHMIRSHDGISFDSFKNAFRELYFRLYMIRRASALAAQTQYNGFADDSYIFCDADWEGTNTLWKCRPCTHEGKIYQKCAYTSAKSSTPYKAIQSCYSSTQTLDCAGFTITHMFGSLAETLGEAEFNSMGNDIFTIAPYHVGIGTSSQAPVFDVAILEEITITDLNELLPGDIVYFSNLPDYSTLSPDGYWSGEYCIYLGTVNEVQMFVGLGVDESSYDELVSTISGHYIDAYNAHQKASKKKKAKLITKIPDQSRKKLLKCGDIVGQVYPGISRTVFCMHAFRSGGFFSNKK